MKEGLGCFSRFLSCLSTIRDLSASSAKSVWLRRNPATPLSSSIVQWNLGNLSTSPATDFFKLNTDASFKVNYQKGGGIIRLVDGDTSTNDCVIAMASGLAGPDKISSLDT